MFLRWLVVLLMGGTMAIPNIDWNKFENLAETDGDYKFALELIRSFDAEKATLDSQRRVENELRDSRNQNIELERAVIMAHEGFRENAYSDPLRGDDVPTIGFGFTGGVQMGDTMDKETALARLDQEIEKHREILFAELALNTASLRKGSSDQDYINRFGDGWQYDFISSEADGEKYAPLPSGAAEPYVELDQYGHVTIYGFENREELLAAGQERYQSLDANTQAAVMSITYNYGSAGGPDFVKEINKAVDTGDVLALADYIDNTEYGLASNDGGALYGRRNDEANLIRTGRSKEVAAHAATGTLREFGMGDPFQGGSAALPKDTGYVGATRSRNQGTGQQNRMSSRAFMADGSLRSSGTQAQPAQETTLSGSGPFLGIPSFADTLGDATGLSEQYGAFGFFMYDRDIRGDLYIGLDINGNPVAYNDPSKLTEVDVVTYIESTNIDPTTENAMLYQIPSLLRKTEWGMENNSRMREFDVEYQKKSEADRLEFLQATIDQVSDSLRGLGYELSDQEVYNLAYQFQRLNGPVTQTNTDTLYKTIFAEIENKEMVNELNEFQGMVENTLVTAGDYYLNMNEEQAREYAEQLLTGDLTQEEFKQMLQDQAYIAYPHLEEQATKLGVTPKQLLFNTETSIENLLGKKVDLRDSKWNPVINYVDNSGSPRLMTTWEAENYVRSTGDYLGSNKGQEKIYSLVDALADSFGRV